jgi:hypothetical protein
MPETPVTQILRESAAHIAKKALGSQAALESIFPWGGGARNDCYGICTQHPTGKFFLKIEKGNDLPRTRWGQIKREVHGVRQMQAAGVPCPALIAYDTSGEEIGQKYALVEFLEEHLIWEFKDQLTSSDWAGLRQEILEIQDKMKQSYSPVYGDTYPGGVLGQYSTWQAACRSMGRLLLEDSLAMHVFTPGQQQVATNALEKVVSCLISRVPASFLHLDLGPHNVLAARGTDGVRIKAVIDFGSSLYGPYYVEDNFRKFAGWGLDEVDVCREYGVRECELRAVELLWSFEFALFAASIRWGEYQKRLDEFIEDSRRLLEGK